MWPNVRIKKLAKLNVMRRYIQLKDLAQIFVAKSTHRGHVNELAKRCLNPKLVMITGNEYSSEDCLCKLPSISICP